MGVGDRVQAGGRRCHMSHTKEPWSWCIGVMESVQVAIDGADGSEITGWLEPKNARRIVACVNACAGLPTEFIEKYGVTRSGIAKGTELLEADRDRLAAELAALRSQEPVAWMHPSRDPKLLSHSAYTYGSCSIPLYTSPTPTDRDAVCKTCNGDGGWEAAAGSTSYFWKECPDCSKAMQEGK